MQTPPPLPLDVEADGYDGLSALLVRLADCAGSSLSPFPLRLKNQEIRMWAEIAQLVRSVVRSSRSVAKGRT